MMLVSFRPIGSTEPWRAGLADGQHLLDAAKYQDSLDQSPHQPPLSAVRQVLAQGPAYLDGLFAWAREQLIVGTSVTSLSSAELGPPVPDPDKIICLGVNYREHAAEAQQSLPVAPMFFAKFRNSLVGPAGEVVIPQVSSQIDYEGELAAVIGTRCKEVSEEDALSYVAGYSIMNDVSARDVQLQTSQWMAGKALDTFAPMGPGIVLTSEIPDPQALRLVTRVNGLVVQDGHTSQMIFSVAQAIAFLSRLMTLEPGDIIATGTPSGVGFKRTPPLFLKNGDVTEVELEGVGVIRNPVVGARVFAGSRS
jgi:acylpyruvate hydrolase